MAMVKRKAEIKQLPLRKPCGASLRLDGRGRPSPHVPLLPEHSQAYAFQLASVEPDDY